LPQDAAVPALIDFRHVTVVRSFDGQRPGLDDVSLEIAAGEHVCVLGPNGSGKSTLIKTIIRECYPVARQETSLRILGRELWNIFDLRSELGIVAPDLLAACSSDAVGLDIVLSGFFSATRVFPHHRPSADLRLRAEAALGRLGIAHLASRPVRAMSSGEAKRTLIARALAHNPKTLLLDEPSTALDIGAQIRLRDTLRQLSREAIGIVLVTHQVSEIIPEIARVVILREGKIVADGAKRDVLESGRLSDLFGVRVRVEENEGYFHLY
jgi:iron complex transport system ATP-binding protein